jgi:hypothetical protein
MRRALSLLLILTVWLHAALMVPLHAHGQGQGHAHGAVSTQDHAPQGDDGLDAGCVWCAWAGHAFGLAPAPDLRAAHATRPTRLTLPPQTTHGLKTRAMAPLARGPPALVRSLTSPLVLATAHA